MPLIIITGTPCSGKTHRAQQIAKEFESRIDSSASTLKRSIVYLPSYHASSDPLPEDSGQELFSRPKQDRNLRDKIYDSAKLEKTARAEEFSSIKRAINKNAIVIADAPNYIKGFRYQLFCEAKAAGTRSVVVHTAAREDECIAWNNSRLEAWGLPVYTDEKVPENVSQITGPKVGRDVLGDLKPESHTALFGDNTLDENTGIGARSRSSSTGAAVSDDENGDTTQQQLRQTDETMTLKSLYISDKNDQTTTTAIAQPLEPTLPTEQEPATSTPSCTSTLPPSTPPRPRSSLPYSPSIHKSLLMRYEPPSPFTRWDTPLFTVPSTDPHPPYTAIWTALFPPAPKSTSKKALALARQSEEQKVQPKAQNAQCEQQTPELQQEPRKDTAQEDQNQNDKEKEKDQTASIRMHASTVLPSATTPNALQVLESTTGEITKLLLAAARATNAADGDGGLVQFSLPLPGEDPLVLSLDVPEGTGLSQPVLQRLRRKYTQLQRGGIAHGQGYTKGKRNVAEGFVRFLEAEWEGDGT